MRVSRMSARGANRKFKLPRQWAETPMRIRTARPDDEAQWRGLWRGYTEFYETHPPENVTAAHGDGTSRRNPRFRAGSPSKRAGCRDSPIRRRTRELSFRRPYAIWRIYSSTPTRAEVADFGAWQAPRGEGAILPIEPCDGKSTLQRRSPSLYRSILWSGDRTCETPKS